MNRIIKAIRFADKKHENQKRKVTGFEYICHPIFVSYKIASFKKSKHFEDLIVAAILHDTIEDTNTTFNELLEEFGIFVASLVFELTNDENEISKIGKLEYQKNKLTNMSSYALTLKLCDRLCNILDNPTDKYKEDTIFLLLHVELNRKLTKTQIEIISEIYKSINLESNKDDNKN